MTRRYVGTSVPRRDGPAKVTGSAQYTVDMTVPGMTYGAVLRSTRASAIIGGIDVSRAEEAPGVLAVLTSESLEGLFPYYGHIIVDHPVLARERVRFIGEPVALVVAESPREAARALSLIAVDYVDTPAVVSIDEALAVDAPIVHQMSYPRGEGMFWETRPDETAGNVAHESRFERGDVDSQWDRAARVVETEASYPMLYGYAMEPYVAIAGFHGDSLHVHSSAQHPFMVRNELARIFRMPLSKVRVETPYVGGGYGTKSWTKVEPLASVGAWIVKRPVKVALSVEESILTTRSDGSRTRVRSAFTADGELIAREFDIRFNTGAYADSSPAILDKAVHRCFGPYRIPHLRIHAQLVYTNTVPASSYRGYGAPQTNIAGEYNMDRAAVELGMSAAAIRQKNLIHPGGTVLERRRPLDADLVDDLRMLTEALEGVAPVPGTRSGVGFGCSVSDAGSFPTSIATARILADGSVAVSSGAVEMGQGSQTVLSQIAAEELGVAISDVSVVQSDTARAAVERTTNGSRTTTLVGLATLRACRDAIQKAKEIAAELWGVDVGDVRHEGSSLTDGADRTVGFPELMAQWYGPGAGEIIGIGEVRPAGSTEAMPPFWEIGMGGVAISIDPETGSTTVRRLVTVGDVGCAINPTAMHGQDLGAATQGLGAALFEELVYEGGQLINSNVVDYRVPRTTDMPDEIVTLLAERGDGVGPYGAKGGGEGALNPMGGAVAVAVSRALGVWQDTIELPLTPERVWRMATAADEPHE